MAYRTFSATLEKADARISLLTANIGDTMLFTRSAYYTAFGTASHVLTIKRTATIGIEGSLLSGDGSTVSGPAGTVGSVTVRVGDAGSIISNGGFAFEIGGDTFSLYNRGQVSGLAGVFATAAHAAITNAGAISGQYGLDLTATDVTVGNTGDIVGSSGGIRVVGDGGGQQISNSGRIDGGAGTAIDVRATGDVLIVNTGTISARTGINLDVNFSAVGGDRTVVNTGLISAVGIAVFGSSAHDTLINRGTLAGRVDLFAGDDLYDGSQGTASGPVDGGAGDDALIGSLAARNLLLGGDGADELTGGDRGDVLVGGLDADQLEGGTGLDVASYRDRFGSIQANLASGVNPDGDTYVSIEGLEGGAGDDGLTGDSGVNRLIGGGGDDRLIGGGGLDTLIGGAGDDLYIDPGKSRIVETAAGGIDTVWSSNSYTLPANVERLELIQGFNADGTGNALDNTIVGTPNNNVLDGKEGNDTLTGFIGTDTFVFSTTPSAANVDRITDFNAIDDFLKVSRAVFTALPSASTLTSDAFWSGASAHDADDRIIFDPATRNLFYDADGIGGVAQVQVAHLDGASTPAAADILVY